MANVNLQTRFLLQGLRNDGGGGGGGGPQEALVMGLYFFRRVHCPVE